MASSKTIMIALLFAFAMVTAPSVASRPTGFKAAAAAGNHEAPAEPLLHPSTASSGASPTPPGLPGLPQLPGGIGGLIAGILFPPLLPLLPFLPTPQQVPAVGASPPQPTECMTPLVNVMPCADYLTNLTVLTPPGACCDGLKSVIRDAPICLCHGMNGGLNKFLPKPVDPVRMLVLPLSCGTVLPLQTLFQCSSSQVPPIMPDPVPAQPPTSTPSASP